MSVPTWNEEMDHILHQVFRVFWISIKKINPSIRTYVNKIENRITFKIKTGYYLKFFTPETIKLLGSTKIKIKNNENGENVPYIKITEVILHCNIVSNNYQ